MDLQTFLKIYRDPGFTDYDKMSRKYPGAFDEALRELRASFYIDLPLPDLSGASLVMLRAETGADHRSRQLLLRDNPQGYGVRTAENEIISSARIESIDYSRDSVRDILRGRAPRDEEERRILGMKQGLEFICDPGNDISEENIYHLYMTAIGRFLPPEDRPKEGAYYRDDEVFIVSDRIEHTGAPAKKLPAAMRAAAAFAASEDDGVDPLTKGAILHFYLAWLHPYFDGNGRMARLLHLWYLLRAGYCSALFLPFSSLIEKSRKEYYNAFTRTEKNSCYSGLIDVTPFLRYFTEKIYNRLPEDEPTTDTQRLRALREDGKITEKEQRLWDFVLSRYGGGEFSTKMLEKDFGDAAYATIRAFVLKFTDLELLIAERYGSRTKYRVKF